MFFVYVVPNSLHNYTKICGKSINNHKVINGQTLPGFTRTPAAGNLMRVTKWCNISKSVLIFL